MPAMAADARRNGVRPEPGLTPSPMSGLALAAGRAVLRERSVQRDLGHARERLRDRAVRLRVLGLGDERRPRRARAPSPRTVSAIFVMPVPGTNVTVAECPSCSGGVPSWASPCESAIE